MVNNNDHMKYVKCVMGSWGIAIDMAKRNANNLARLGSRRELYKDFVQHGDSKNKKIYKFKTATPELLESIRIERALENEKARVKRRVLGVVCLLAFIAIIYAVMTL